MHEEVLIVEDEARLAELLSQFLTQAGYRAAIEADGAAVVPRVRREKPAALLLDVMLPNRDGMSICREIRSFSDVPILMTTARIDEIDRLLGLELGADDYICKPYSPPEVVARVRAVLRRRQPGAVTDTLLHFDDDRMQASLAGRPLVLTAVEYQLLRILASDPGRIHSRDRLMERIYSDHRVVSGRTIDSHIRKLRRKLELSLPERELVHSVYGVGYKYEVTNG